MNIKKNTLWNLFGSAAPMLIGVAAIPYIFAHLGVERTGVLTIIWALIGYFSIFDFGLGRAITQRIASLGSQQSVREKKTIATTGAGLTFLIGMAGALIGFGVIEVGGIGWLNSAPYLGDEIKSAFILACLAVPATTTTAGLRGIIEGEQRFKAINLLRFVLGVSNFLSPVASIYAFGPRLDYMVALLVLTRYAVLLAHYLAARHTFGNPLEIISSKESKKLLHFGGWMTLSNIISPLMVVADRFLIASALGASVVAYYTIPADLMIRLLILPAAITSTLFPVFSMQLSRENWVYGLSLYRKSIAIIFVIMGIITTTIFFGANFALEVWLGGDFARNSSAVVSYLAVGILFNSMAQVPMAYIQGSGDARSTALIHAIEFVLYVPVLILLMQLHGIRGAALAWTLRSLADLALLHFTAMRIKR